MTGHGVTNRDLAALTYLAGRLREETYGCGAWDQRGLEVKVAEFKNQNLAIVVEQILRHATDLEAKTPGALHRKFSPPMPSEREPMKRGNPKVGDEGECRQHPGQWADNCGGCATKKLPAYHEHEPLPRAPSHADASYARAMTAAAITPADCYICQRGRMCPVHRETATTEETA
jgi:hypothetical protein